MEPANVQRAEVNQLARPQRRTAGWLSANGSSVPHRVALLALAWILASAMAVAGCGDDGGSTETDVAEQDGDVAVDTGTGIDTIEPCPSSGAQIQAAPLVLEFGPIMVGMTQARDLQVNSGGSGQLCLTAGDYTLDPPGSPFLVGPLNVEGTPTTALNPANTGTITLTFLPSIEGSGLTTLTLNSDNGGSASVSLSWTASPPILPLGSLNLGFVTTYVFDGERFDTDPTYRAEHPEGVSQVQVFSGMFGDGFTLPAGEAMSTMAAAKHYNDGTVVIEQTSYADADQTIPANPQAVLVVPDTIEPGNIPIDISRIGDPSVPLLVVYDVDEIGSKCVRAVGTGNLVVGQAVDINAEGGAFAVTAGGVQLFLVHDTPAGDITSSLALVGWSVCPQ